MPKYTFDCACGVRFTKTLKMGAHVSHPCPGCQALAPRLWEGQGFAFEFQAGQGAPGNSGVSKHDYPTADNAVGRDAERKWDDYEQRKVAKEKLRAESGHSALECEYTSKSVTYKPGGEPLVRKRKALVAAANRKVAASQ